MKEEQRLRAIREYIEELVEIVLDLEPIIITESQYEVDLHLRKIKDKLDEIGTV